MTENPTHPPRRGPPTRIRRATTSRGANSGALVASLGRISLTSLIILRDVNSQSLDRDGEQTSFSFRSLETDPLDLQPRCNCPVRVIFGRPFDSSNASRADRSNLHLKQTFQEEGYENVSQDEGGGSKKEQVAQATRDRHGRVVVIRSGLDRPGDSSR